MRFDSGQGRVPVPLRLLGSSLTVGLCWLAFPGGAGLWPLLFFALVPFLAAVFRAGSWRQAAVCGIVTGLLYFLVLLYWIVIVLGRYGGLPFPLPVLALVLLALYMSLYMGVFAVTARLIFSRMSPVVVLWSLPCLWVALDWCRAVLFTGFPWMDFGYALADVPWLIQSADLWGHYGLTFILVLANVLAALLVIACPEKRERSVLFVPVILVCGAVALYSFVRWGQVERLMQAGAVMRMGVVQGNIAQDQKWSAGMQKETLAIYFNQSLGLVERNRPALVIWPETALPFYAVAHPLMQSVSDLARQGRVALLAGAPWYEQDTGKSSDGLHYYNSALLVDDSGWISGRSSKSHLVPFGEYVPLKGYLPFLAPVVESVADFSPGTIQEPLACQNARIGVLICFESIFPEIARQWVASGANVLVNLTNDAWYGRSSAPYHSLAMTVLRSVETRRSLVRSANTGFSGFVDPLGRVQLLSPLFEVWAGAADVALVEEKTFFVRWGYRFAPLCLGLALLPLAWIVLQNPRAQRKM